MKPISPVNLPPHSFPGCERLHHKVTAIPVNTGQKAPYGFRGLAVSADGKRLYVAVPGRALLSNNYDRSAPDARGEIRILDIDRASPQYRKKTWVVKNVGIEPYAVIASSDPNRVAFTNCAEDGRGVGVLTATNLEQTDWQVKYIALGFPKDYNRRNDTFDVNNALGIAITRDFKYAFVTGFNQYLSEKAGGPTHDPYYDQVRPAGSNVGIIRDPFGLHGTPGKPLVTPTRLRSLV